MPGEGPGHLARRGLQGTPADRQSRIRGVRWVAPGTRAAVIVALALVVVVASGYLLAGAGMMHDMGGASMPMSSGPWTPAHALLVVVMWIAMMAAMMLPSAAPMVLFHAAVARQREGRTAPAGLSGAFVLGYLAVWSAFSVAATALQYALERLALLSPMMQTTSTFLAGAILVAAGVYQWTPLKRACLQHCRSPFAFVMAHWRDGIAGAFAMGARHGSTCLGCCWLLMLLLFIGGVMNVGWIAGIAVFVAIEKLVPASSWVSRAAGALLVAWGLATWFT
jgi:predicted metal-binding membrane protein